MQGHGIYKNSYGYIYEGQWGNNLMHGFGILTSNVGGQ